MGNVRLFNEAHGFLQNVSGELELFKKEVLQDHEQRKQEIADARKKLEQEKFERREQINKLRYEFEDFVNRKVDRVLEEIEEMKRNEKRDDDTQQKQIDHIVSDMEMLREDLFNIQAVACVFCQILVNAVKKQSQLNKDRPRDERYGEEEVTEVLLELCSTAAPRIAKSLDGYAKDAEMLCRRVVNENAGEMLDAASLGEDLDSFCKDSKLCPFGLEALTKFMSAMADTQNSKKSSPKGEVGQKELKNLVEAMQAMKGEDDDDEL